MTRCRHCANGSVHSAPRADQHSESKPCTVGVAQAKIISLGIQGEVEARSLLRRALREAEPAAQRFGWHLARCCELPADDDDVGYTDKDGTIFVKVRDPSSTGIRSGGFYSYSFVLATLLHEMAHLTHLGHGKAFYRCLAAALSACGTEPYVRREARNHVCAELLNAVCDNDARRARALLAVMPEAAVCRRPGVGSSQFPLEYAAHHGRVAITKLLLEARADPALCSGPCGSKGMAPLVRAAANGNPKTAALLLAARANVVKVPEPHGQSVLDKAIAAAEAGGFAGKDGEWCTVMKVLNDDCNNRHASGPTCNTAARRDRGARSSSRRRRQRPTCTEGAEVGGGLPRRVMSMPALPAVATLPALSNSEVRRRITFGSLAGSLAL